jgi:Zn-dependent oligopeptidase
LDQGTDGSLQISMAYPHVIPFMEQAERRDLREALAFKFSSRAVDANRPVLQEAVEARERIAQLFGLDSWAHYQMEEKMAKNPAAVEAFYAELIPPLSEGGRAEIAVMADMLATDTESRDLQLWDWRYYDTQLRKREFGIDTNQVAEYFKLEDVIAGMFDLTAEVFGLTYQPVPDAKAWHEEVLLYQILDTASGEHLAYFYADLFPRDGKFSHAAAFPLYPGHREPDGMYRRPISAIVANLTKPTADRPALLQHAEVETLFHEFGHILHMSLTNADFTRFSGANTEWDFVEAPSQIMEEWCWQPEVLQRFARHYQTGEPIPEELVNDLVRARHLNVALHTLRQVSFGVFDMGLHGPGDHSDMDLIHERAETVGLLPPHEGTFFPASFGHLLGGYDAGYYGYLWSKVYGLDMFSRFAEEGVTSPEVGQRYRREILEPGGSLDGDQLLRNFLGREPSNEAFLHHIGIT